MIDSFIRSWLYPGFSRVPDQHKLQTLEDRVGVRLPASAREWCYFTWATPKMERYCLFRDDFTIERLKDHEAVSLLIQGEGDYYWAIETQFLEQDDPPVSAYCMDFDAPVKRFLEAGRWSSTVSSFALGYLLTSLQSPGGTFQTRISSPAFNRKVLIADLGNPTTFGDLEFFTGDGIIAYTSLLPDNGQYGYIDVHIQRKTQNKQLPLSIQKLIQAAHAIWDPYSIRKQEQ